MRVCFATSSERLDSSQTSREHGSPCSVQYSQTYTSSIYSTNSTQYCIVGLFFQGKTHHHKPGAKTSSTVRYEQCKLQCENPTHFKYTWRCDSELCWSQVWIMVNISLRFRLHGPFFRAATFHTFPLLTATALSVAVLQSLHSHNVQNIVFFIANKNTLKLIYCSFLYRVQ